MRAAKKLMMSLVTAGAAGLCQAAVVVNLFEAGADVLASGSGTLNTTSLSAGGSGASANALAWGGFPFGSVLNIGGSAFPAPSVNLALFSGISGPSSFGTGGRTFANAVTGDQIGIIANLQLQLPSGYASGSPLSGTATWSNQSLVSLGLNTGTYVWSWGSGNTADSFTLNISPVPESSSVAMMMAGLAWVGVAWRRRQRATTA